jgi:putative CocE/NonD family hydrolase
MTLPWQDPPARYREVDVERDVPYAMPDGVALVADVYRPRGDGPWPVLLMRHPYDKTRAEDFVYASPLWYARHGYLVVVQDCRGRWASQGEWYPFRDEADDGARTVAWAASLPGSSGRVGMYGFSYAGSTQYLAAGRQPRGLATIMPAMTGADYYDGWTYRGGALHYAFALSWTLYLAQETAHRRGDYALEAELTAALGNLAGTTATAPGQIDLLRRAGIAPYYDDWLRHDTWDAYWQQWSPRRCYEQIAVPALHVDGWYDIFLEGTLENFTGLQQCAGSESARRGQKLVVGPWYHSPWKQTPGAVDYGEDARNCIDALQVLWLDKHLRGERNQLDDEPPVALFVMGANRWRFEDAWPPPAARPTTYYLRSQGRANSLNGNGTLDQRPPDDDLPDVFTYDPRSPVLSLGGHSCCIEVLCPMGAFDQRTQEYRNDVLVYTGAVLVDDLTVIGTVEAVLYAATSAADTDFTAKLVDVYPDGQAINVGEGILRARYRESLERPTPIVPGRVYEYRIRIGSTAQVFRAGHRLRVEIASSNFPAFDRHTNSLRPIVDAGPADWAVATQTVFHDARYPSHVVLPVVPG